MSDQPLFQNTDAQEQAYAPQDLAPGDPAGRQPTDELGAQGRDSAASGIGVPAVAAGAMSSGSASLGGGGASAGTPGAAAAAGGAILTDDTGARDIAAAGPNEGAEGTRGQTTAE